MPRIGLVVLERVRTEISTWQGVDLIEAIAFIREFVERYRLAMRFEIRVANKLNYEGRREATRSLVGDDEVPKRLEFGLMVGSAVSVA